MSNGDRPRASPGLLETEALELAPRLGLAVPRCVVLPVDPGPSDLDRIPRELPPRRGAADRVVVKALSRELPHKSERGAVRAVSREREAVERTLRAMAGRLEDVPLEGFGVFDWTPHDSGPAGELLLGLRWTGEFGAVVTVGPGGVGTEVLEESLAPGKGAVTLSPSAIRGAEPEEARRRVRAVLASRPLLRAAGEPFRGREPAVSLDELAALVVRALGAAEELVPGTVVELEFNPVALTSRGPVALDGAGRRGSGETPPLEPRRPVEKIGRLLEPRSAAVLGVSGRSLNPGRTILRNLLALGFPADSLWVVKEGKGPIDGCRRVPDLASLPEPVDLLVLAVAGEQVPAVMEEVVAGERAESVVVIPGGLGETAGTEERARAVRRTLAASRSTPWRGPVVNGGNCLGVRSVPGGVDTLFIPRHKLRFPEDREPDPLALVSQSGAFAVARASKLSGLAPRHLITVGNQLDLTVGDYVEYLAEDPESRVVACYVEGFRPGDGRRFLEAAARIVERGRSVLLYRAGRTAAGARASASHTASVAGDFAVTRDLARQAGAVVAETLEDFEDLVSLFILLDGKRPAGRRLGALTNAGFEAVAMADRLGPLELAEYGGATRERIAELLAERRLGEIVTVGNPLDVTPMLDDEGFAEAARAVLLDPGVDVGVIGCVPLTGAMETAGPCNGEGPEHPEDGTAPGAVASRLAALAGEVEKPWVAVVDSGGLYDPMAGLLERAGIPTFRAADRAVRLLGTWAEAQLGA